MTFVRQPYLDTAKLRRAAYRHVRRLWPTAYRVQRVDGGYAVFSTADEYRAWRTQH